MDLEAPSSVRSNRTDDLTSLGDDLLPSFYPEPVTHTPGDPTKTQDAFTDDMIVYGKY